MRFKGKYTKLRLIFFVLTLGFFLIFTPIRFLKAQTKDCSRTSVGFTPLIDMGEDQYYPSSSDPNREEGGLYEGGLNVLPADHSHMQRAYAATSEIRPRNASGAVDEINGKIGFASLGMSNTYQEFGDFMNRANGAGTLKSSKVVLINGAWYGQASYEWAYPPSDPSLDPWETLSNRVASAGLDKRQVQVFWVKLTMKTPIYPRDNWPVFSQTLQDHLGIIVKRIKTEYPNTKVIYFSSRTYAGYSGHAPLSPEPSSYESAFAFKWIINDQIAGGGRTGVNYSNAPVLLWGHYGPGATTYLWADGTRARSDGLTYVCDDFTDGVHPSASGKTKITNMLYSFFTQDSLAKVWFTGSGTLPSVTPPTSTPTSSVTKTPSPTPVPGDATGEGVVDGRDFTIWAKNFGQSFSGASNGDFNNNKIVDVGDYLIWISNYK